MKIEGKVIFDNGYKIELIRPLHDQQLKVGTSVILTVDDKQVDLIHTFNNLLDERTKDMILDKFNEARRIEVTPPVATHSVNTLGNRKRK